MWVSALFPAGIKAPDILKLIITLLEVATEKPFPAATPPEAVVMVMPLISNLVYFIP